MYLQISNLLINLIIRVWSKILLTEDGVRLIKKNSTLNLPKFTFESEINLISPLKKVPMYSGIY